MRRDFATPFREGREAAAHRKEVVDDLQRLYAIARGSAMECAAIVDVARARRLASTQAAAEARGLLVRIVQMLTKLDQALR